MTDTETEAMELWWEAYGEFCYGAADHQAAAAIITTKLAELQARIERDRKALLVLANLPIVESDTPDTLHLDGVPHTGPAVDYLFRIIRKIKHVASEALEADNGA